MRQRSGDVKPDMPTFSVVDIVNGEFPTPMGWRSGHLQTIRSRIVRRNYNLSLLSRQRSELVAVDDSSGDQLVLQLHENVRPEVRGVVLLVHGLGGSAESDYVRASALALLQAGFHVARIDLRGAGLSWNTCTQLYHAGKTSDLRTVIARLAQLPEVGVGDRPFIFVMGFSLGGNTTIKLVGEPLRDLPVKAAVAVSSPLDLVVGSEHLRQMAFGAYDKYLLSGLRRQILQPGPDGQPRVTPVERDALKASKSIEDFDDAITSRRNGWRDAQEYYEVNSSGQFLPRAGVPLLVIHSVDDPMIPAAPYQSIDWDALAQTSPVRRAVTPHGGHVGFHEKSLRLPWYARVAARFFVRQATVVSSKAGQR